MSAGAAIVDGSTGGAPQDWRASLPEPLRAEKSLESFKDVGSLAQSFVETKKKLGGAISVPGANATEQEREAFYARIGRPEKPEAYTFDKPAEVPSSFDTLEASARLAFHKNGLNQAQASGVMGALLQNVIESEKAQQAKQQEAIAGLKKEWGAEYDVRIEQAKRAIDKLGDQSLKDYLNESGLGDNPMLIRVFAKYGESLSEDRQLITGAPPDEAAVGAVQAKIDAIRADPKHPYNDVKATRTAREAAFKEVNSLYRQLTGE